MKPLFERIIFMLTGAFIALAGVCIGHFYLGNTEGGSSKVSDNMSEYSEEEKFVIKKLRESMHDPSSLQVISISSESMLSYDGYDKWSLQDQLFLLEKDDVKVYTIKYRGANAYGALRLGTAIGTYWDDDLLGPTCYFRSEEDEE